MSRFDRNYTEEGYLMNYETPKLSAPFKRRVLQFKVELEDIEPAIWMRTGTRSASTERISRSTTRMEDGCTPF